MIRLDSVVRDAYNRGEQWAKDHPIVSGVGISLLSTVLGFAMGKIT